MDAVVAMIGHAVVFVVLCGIAVIAAVAVTFIVDGGR